MKLSDLTTDRAADVLCEIGTYIINITTDEELTAELKKKAEKDKELVDFFKSCASAAGE